MARNKLFIDFTTKAPLRGTGHSQSDAEKPTRKMTKTEKKAMTKTKAQTKAMTKTETKTIQGTP